MTKQLIKHCGTWNSKIVHPSIQETRPRNVDCFEFEYILASSSSCTAFINTQEIRLLPSTILLRKPGETTKSILHFKSYYIHTLIDCNSPFYEELISFPNYYIFIDASIYKKIFEELIKHELENVNNENHYYTAAKLLELFHHLKKDASKQKDILQKYYASHYPEVIQKAILFMQQNFEKKITLKSLADFVDYSPNHFRKIFSDIMNISPQKYLLNMRISRAKYLLIQNKLSLIDISFACGFSSQAHFSLIFKEETGFTPNEFRKNELKKYIL